MAFFTSTVWGYPAETAFDCESPTSISIVSPSFSSMFNYRRIKSGMPISVVTTMGVFSCLVNLVPEPIDAALMWKSAPWVPDSQMILSDNTCLVLSSFPFSASLPCRGVYLVKNSCFTTSHHVYYLCLRFVDWKLGLRTVPYYGYGRIIYGIYGPTLKLWRYG